MEIRVGDRLADEQGEWEVDTHPAALHGGKSLHAKLRKVGEPGIVRYVAWPVHEKLTISEVGRAASPMKIHEDCIIAA